MLNQPSLRGVFYSTSFLAPVIPSWKMYYTWAKDTLRMVSANQRQAEMVGTPFNY
jgi:hypothetical protein